MLRRKWFRDAIGDGARRGCVIESRAASSEAPANGVLGAGERKRLSCRARVATTSENDIRKRH
jgi:hypothetical protein